jgi:hypothetical protein
MLTKTLLSTGIVIVLLIGLDVANGWLQDFVGVLRYILGG